MRCTSCQYWLKSRLQGNHCTCTRSVKPCELERHNKQYKAKKRKKLEKYDKSMRKMRF